MQAACDYCNLDHGVSVQTLAPDAASQGFGVQRPTMDAYDDRVPDIMRPFCSDGHVCRFCTDYHTCTGFLARNSSWDSEEPDERCPGCGHEHGRAWMLEPSTHACSECGASHVPVSNSRAPAIGRTHHVCS